MAHVSERQIKSVTRVRFNGDDIVREEEDIIRDDTIARITFLGYRPAISCTGFEYAKLMKKTDAGNMPTHYIVVYDDDEKTAEMWFDGDAKVKITPVEVKS